MNKKIEVDVIASGSRGNATIVRADDTTILIDAGISAKRITKGFEECDLDPSELSGILITHEHSDHIGGLRVFSKKYDVPIFATEKTWGAMPIKNEIERKNRRVLKQDLHLGNLKVDFFKTSHDAADPVGYNIYASKGKLSYLTDCGCVLPKVVQSIDGADVLVLETNHDVNMLKNGSYPLVLQDRILGEFGHLSNFMAVEILEQLHTLPKEIFLAHLSQENNSPKLALEAITEAVAKLGKSKIYVTRQDMLVNNR